jgi:NTP pyrophosphatase (non-canonical NTP hydrolase)
MECAKMQLEIVELGREIDLYAEWAETRWVDSKLPGIEPGLASELVMALGLGGETGEVAEEVLAVDVSMECSATGNLVKELGDAFYYFCRLTKTFGFQSSALFEGKPVLQAYGLQGQALCLTVAASRVLEACKKYVRDGQLDRRKLEDGLLDFASAWRGLCACLSVHPLTVIQRNHDKIEARFEAGTLRGSGNDR